MSCGAWGRLGRTAVERSLTAKLEDARDALIYKVIELLAVYRSHFAKNIAGTTLMIPEQLRHFALMMLSLVKHVRERGAPTRRRALAWPVAEPGTLTSDGPRVKVEVNRAVPPVCCWRGGGIPIPPNQVAFRAGNRVGLDERAWAMGVLRVLPWELSNLYILPRLYALHLLDAAVRGHSGRAREMGARRRALLARHERTVDADDDGVWPVLGCWVMPWRTGWAARHRRPDSAAADAAALQRGSGAARHVPPRRWPDVAPLGRARCCRRALQRPLRGAELRRRARWQGAA